MSLAYGSFTHRIRKLTSCLQRVTFPQSRFANRPICASPNGGTTGFVGSWRHVQTPVCLSLFVRQNKLNENGFANPLCRRKSITKASSGACNCPASSDSTWVGLSPALAVASAFGLVVGVRADFFLATSGRVAVFKVGSSRRLDVLTLHVKQHGPELHSWRSSKYRCHSSPILDPTSSLLATV